MTLPDPSGDVGGGSMGIGAQVEVSGRSEGESRREGESLLYVCDYHLMIHFQ